MAKNIHEIRDPIHVFIRVDSAERMAVDSRPFQRLRNIHQLALSYLVYPGATHKRFEHSLGVMELAGRVFDVVTHRDNVTEEVIELLPEIASEDKLRYWRRVIRMAAMCHDLGHLPFSHAAEHELLPEGWTHERLSLELILSQEMRGIWNSMTPPLRPEDVVKLAVGPKKAAGYQFSDWELVLSEIIVGDAFGVDRMDYLLRDSLHTGVAYGRFDHYRLIDSLRILAFAPSRYDENRATLGIDEGGLQSAEALLLARYFMFSQVYLHPVRRVYDIHLKDFLISWLADGKFSTDLEAHLAISDNDVLAALYREAYDANAPSHQQARRIACREHFRVLYQRFPEDIEINPNSVQQVFEAAEAKFGEENVRRDIYMPKGTPFDFPVRQRDQRIVSSLSLSETLAKIPVASAGYVFIAPEHRSEAENWLKAERAAIIAPTMED